MKKIKIIITVIIILVMIAGIYYVSTNQVQTKTDSNFEKTTIETGIATENPTSTAGEAIE